MKKNIRFSILILAFAILAGNTHAAGYDFYVDDSSTEATEDGTETLPFKTIGAALLHIENEQLKSKTLFIKKGTYEESLNVKNNTDLIGESESETIIDATGKKNSIKFLSTKSKMRNLIVKNADATNIIVDSRSQVLVKDSSIEGAGKFGIEVEESSATNKYKFTISDSSVSENGSQGLYISKRKISLTGNEIDGNDQEGIDLHSWVKGTVSGNNINGNGESGIESILAGANLNIKSNKIENNHAQGITVQAYTSKKKGKVKISKNTIKENHDYGIRYANYTHSIGPKKFKIFIDKCVKLSRNTNKDNGDGDTVYE